MLEVELRLLADGSVGVERGLDAVTKARGVHGCDWGRWSAAANLCLVQLATRGFACGCWSGVCGVCGGGGRSGSGSRSRRPELHDLLEHGEVGEVGEGGEVGSGGRWKLRTCVFLEYCDAPLRLASGLWQAKRMCLCPS